MEGKEKETPVIYKPSLANSEMKEKENEGVYIIDARPFYPCFFFSIQLFLVFTKSTVFPKMSLFLFT